MNGLSLVAGMLVAGSGNFDAGEQMNGMTFQAGR